MQRILERPLRVLLISDSFPPLIGGAGRDTALLASALLARGHRVSVATSSQPDAPERETDRGVEINRLPGVVTRMHWLSANSERRIPPPFPDPETTLRLRRLIRRLEPEIVHSYGWMTYSCRLALAGLETPLVISSRDYGLICAKRTLLRGEEICAGPAPIKCLICAGSEYGVAKGALATGTTLGLRRWLARRADGLHNVSRYMSERTSRHFLQAGDPAMAPGRHPVIPGFAETNEGEEIDRSVISLLPERPYILYVGALRICKGIDVLVEAHSQLPDAPPLVLIGPRAPDTPASFPDNVHVLPSTNHATVMESWGGALFAVAPSRLPEPFGNVVHEAMSCAKAVIGTRPGGHEDMIDPGRTGLLVPTGDVPALTEAMRFLLDHPDERAHMGRAAQQEMPRFASDLVTSAFEALYAEALCSRSTAPNGHSKRPY
jgi:glycosyltransferase involved in cell wall biosynthesis